MKVDDKKIIHLYVLNTCQHHCALCCNKQYDTEKIETVTCDELRYANTICITGGEPFLLDEVCDLAKKIKHQYKNIEKIYVYTSGDSLLMWLEKNGSLHDIDGVNISPKNRFDAECIVKIFNNKDYRNQILRLWSNRVYVFEGMDDNWVDDLDLFGYESVKIIRREWQEKFVAASGIFRRLPILMD